MIVFKMPVGEGGRIATISIPKDVTIAEVDLLTNYITTVFRKGKAEK